MKPIKGHKPFLMLVLGLACILPAHAQDATGEQESESPLGIPIAQPEQGDSRAARSFADLVAWNARIPIGLSLQASQGFISSVNPNPERDSSSSLSSFAGTLFANFGRKKSQLHIDIGAGYRIYRRERSMNGSEFSGNSTYSYSATKKLRFQLSDFFSSSLSDPFSNFAPTLRSSIDWTSNPSFDVFFLPRRLTRNQTRAQVDYDLTKSTHLNVFGSYDMYRYGNREFADTNAVQAGAGFDQRITDWLTLATTYATYLNNVNESLRNYQIHRLEIGRLRFGITRNMEVFASGGLEAVDTTNEWRVQGMFRGGISRSSERNVLYANYQRTMISALGLTRLMRSDVVTLGFGQRFSRRINSRLTGSYMRGRTFSDAGALRGYFLRAQFEYAFLSNLFASANYGYQNQRNTIMALANIPYFDRHVAFLTLQFAWPSTRLSTK